MSITIMWKGHMAYGIQNVGQQTITEKDDTKIKHHSLTIFMYILYALGT